MAAWATTTLLRTKLQRYINAPSGDGLLAGFGGATEGEAFLQGQVDAATDLLIARIGGRVTITDASLCGLREVCAQLAAGLALQAVYQGRQEHFYIDGKDFEARALQTLDAFLKNDDATLARMPGVEFSADEHRVQFRVGSPMAKRRWQ